MKKRFTHLKLTCVMFLMLLASSEMYAQWELLKECRATYTMHITKGGNMLLSDYLFDGTGGIYLSKDKGKTWEKTEAADYQYSKFIEAGEYVFAIGSAARIARSGDEGKTWEIISYANALEGIMSPSDLDYTVCYAIAYHKNKLYIGDFSGGGVLYSEDFGENWKLTDREPLMIDLGEGGKGKDSKVMDNIYNLVSFNGELYAFGVFLVARYDEVNNTWKIIRSDSNFMSQSTIFNGKMYCGRSVINDTYDAPFLVCTVDGNEWEEVKRPEGLMDNNVRTITSDDKNIYVGLQSNGIYYTSNVGESWTKISEGLPLYREDVPDAYISPLTIISTDDYLYVAMYEEPFSTRKVSGIYRMAKSELPVSIESVSADNAYNVYADDSYLYIQADENITVSVTDVYGKKFSVALQSGKVDIQNFASGIYIYEIMADNNKVTGKFIKK